MKRVENKNSTKKGITLLTLVVTIVVLVILAGIALVATFGEDGVINKAKEAEKEAKRVEMKTELNLLRETEAVKRNTKGEEYRIEDFIQDIRNGNGLKYNYEVRQEGEKVIASVNIDGQIYITEIETPNPAIVETPSGENAEAAGGLKLGPVDRRKLSFKLTFNRLTTGNDIPGFIQPKQPNDKRKGWFVISMQGDTAKIKNVFDSVRIEGYRNSEIQEYIQHPAQFFTEKTDEAIQKRKKVIKYVSSNAMGIVFLEGTEARVTIGKSENGLEKKFFGKDKTTYSELESWGPYTEVTANYSAIFANKISADISPGSQYGHLMPNVPILYISFNAIKEGEEYQFRMNQEIEISSTLFSNMEEVHTILLIVDGAKNSDYLSSINKSTIKSLMLMKPSYETKEKDDISRHILGMYNLIELGLAGYVVADVNVFRSLPEFKIYMNGDQNENIKPSYTWNPGLRSNTFELNPKLQELEYLFKGATLSNIPTNMFSNNREINLKNLFKGANITGTKPQPRALLKHRAPGASEDWANVYGR